MGRRLNPANIRALMTAGTLCFVIGLVGFIFSGNSLLLWGMSAAVFTVGEIIYAPGEYMLIDHIAPPGMKASYFSAQSLGWLGAAINPLVSGVVLTSTAAFLAVCHLSVGDHCCVGADVKRDSCKTVGAARALLI